jgi:deoxycytidylate deaminase
VSGLLQSGCPSGALGLLAGGFVVLRLRERVRGGPFACPSNNKLCAKKEAAMTDNVSDALNRLYKETSNFLVIGLTGRTGSGCSTAAKILSSDHPDLPATSKIYDTDNDKRKYRIVCGYIRKNWKPFVVIQIRAVITRIFLRLTFDEFCAFVAATLKRENEDVRRRLEGYKHDYIKAHEYIAQYDALPETTTDEKDIKKDRAWVTYFEQLPGFCEKLKAALQDNLGADSYTAVYQQVGDNIRASGSANCTDFNAEKIFAIPKIINKLIKAIRDKRKNGAFIVIDAIRNPFEAVYFHQRYAGFYLVSINTPNSERLSHLRETHKFSEEQIIALDNKEYPRKLSGKNIYISQNIQKCIEIADIHINNPDRQRFNNNELSSQLHWYVALILHPGLVTPTSIERCMQLAYSAKLNSGCISRQVGAVVTDQNFSVKAVGWNNSPQGQTPCILRNAEELLNGGEEGVYSKYERTDEKFHNVLEQTYGPVKGSEHLCGRNLSYCFKDLQNEVEGEKNQVHTRSLHAEENAFLQLAKYGGEPIQGGILFSTASPCELCSKKAYQLGIRTVVYIDPYPGISREHILGAGTEKPELVLFRGALGRAYHRLYQPVMPMKDELQMATGYIIAGGDVANKKEVRLRELEAEVASLKQQIRSMGGIA